MHWELEIRTAPCPWISLRDSRTGWELSHWSGVVAAQVLANRRLPAHLSTGGCHVCDKHLVRQLLLAAAAASLALNQENAMPANSSAGTVPADIAPLIQRLKSHDIPVTPQRLRVAQALFRLRRHLTADQVHDHIRATGGGCSRATVYNTLNLFASQGLVKALVVDPERTYYDIITAPHAHLYNADTGELTDIPSAKLPVGPIPELPDDTELEEVCVVVRIKEKLKARNWK